MTTWHVFVRRNVALILPHSRHIPQSRRYAPCRSRSGPQRPEIDRDVHVCEFTSGELLRLWSAQRTARGTWEASQAVSCWPRVICAGLSFRSAERNMSDPITQNLFEFAGLPNKLVWCKLTVRILASLSCRLFRVLLKSCCFEDQPCFAVISDLEILKKLEGRGMTEGKNSAVTRYHRSGRRRHVFHTSHVTRLQTCKFTQRRDTRLFWGNFAVSVLFLVRQFTLDASCVFSLS